MERDVDAEEKQVGRSMSCKEGNQSFCRTSTIDYFDKCQIVRPACFSSQTSGAIRVLVPPGLRRHRLPLEARFF